MRQIGFDSSLAGPDQMSICQITAATHPRTWTQPVQEECGTGAILMSRVHRPIITYIPLLSKMFIHSV